MLGGKKWKVKKTATQQNDDKFATKSKRTRITKPMKEWKEKKVINT